MLIAKLGKYPNTRDIAFEEHPIGTGIADAVTFQETIEKGRNLRISRQPWVDKGTPRISADHVVVGINVENLLRAFLVNVGKAHKKRKRGQPERTDKLSVVFYAVDFFRAFSATEPTTDERNPFRAFAERFFEIATGSEPLSLEWQVRQILDDCDGPRSLRLSYRKQREMAKKAN